MRRTRPPMKPIPPAAYALLVLLALFWGANWPVLKISLREAPVFWFRLVCTWSSAVGLMAVARASGLPWPFRAPRARAWCWYRCSPSSAGTPFRAMACCCCRQAALRCLSVPVIGMATGIVFLGENPGWRDWMAAGLIVAALALVLLEPRTAPDTNKKQE